MTNRPALPKIRGPISMSVIKRRLTMIGKYSTSAAASVIALLCAPAAHTQQPADAATRKVQRAAFDRPDAPQTVKFGQRAARVGDEVEQAVSLQMRLATSLRQGNQLVEKDQTRVTNSQRRVVTTTDVEQGRPTAVLVRYLEATKVLAASDAAEVPTPAVQPVQGKAYYCRRASGEDGELVITEADGGRTPSPEECEIVAQSMEMVGRPNPLAQFLAGRSVSVGETVALPKELAEDLFNLGDRFGEVTRFDLELEKVAVQSQTPCAFFLARVEAASAGSSQMRMQLEGPLVMQVESCRAVRLALSGPIGMSETRGSYSIAYQLIGTGQLKTSIDSIYRDAN